MVAKERLGLLSLGLWGCTSGRVSILIPGIPIPVLICSSLLEGPALNEGLISKSAKPLFRVLKQAPCETRLLVPSSQP